MADDEGFAWDLPAGQDCRERDFFDFFQRAFAAFRAFRLRSSGDRLSLVTFAPFVPIRSITG
jgi:hypothetical protein